jgi:peptidyl-prolyl cis-trans isomerase D
MIYVTLFDREVTVMNSGRIEIDTNYRYLGSFSIPSLGVEPKVIGTTYTLKDNTMSKPIAGKQAVIVVFVETLGGTVTVPEDLSTEKNNTANSFRNRAESSVNGALIKVGKVEDLRYKFF